MKAEFDLTKMVEEITMQVEETQEEFIFETIHPYCENILQMKINKEELKQILLNGIQKQQQKWIPVSERLPEDLQQVQATISDGGKLLKVIICMYTPSSLFWKDYVTAWRPLPEPYKAESEDRND